ncbi:MAG: DUF814 domain-containing protein, partial [Acholeplasmataceae bacterium]|nr:DUF814 domain-containing protein [Acholeplasmataceae bacterium]
QYQTDRVIILDLIVYDFIDGPLPKRLIFEAMGKHSNLLLVKDNILIDSFKKMFFTEGRQLLPQAEFSFFPVNKKPLTEVTYEDIDSPNDLVDRYMGISPFLAKVMYERKINLLDIALQPTKNLDNGKLYVFDAFPEHANKQIYASISEMLDDRQPSKRKSVESHQLFIQKQLKKYSSKDEKIDRALQVANEKLMQKTWADLIYLSGLELSEKRSSLQSNDVEIFLDPTKTLNENAQAYYKIYQKAKRSIVHLHQQKNINDELIQLFHDFETYLDLSKEGGLKDFEFDLMPFGYKPAQKKNINKKQDTKPNITKIEAHDATFYVGKNNHQNEFLTHHFAKKEDYWFHVKSAPGSHVIVKAHHGMNEPILRLAAMLAAYFSKLRMSSSIPVDYTLVRHLKKIPGKPGYQVTYKNERTIY